MLHDHNPYVIEFKSMLEFSRDNDIQNARIVLHGDRKPKGASNHPGTYNAPSSSNHEIATLMTMSDVDELVSVHSPHRFCTCIPNASVSKIQ